MANVDARKLIPYLNDTLVINSLLLDAGIKTLGDRLEIITTLRTIDRENAETDLQVPGPTLAILSFVQDDSDTPIQMSQMANPRVNA